MFVSSVVKFIEIKTNHMLQISSTLRYSWRSGTSRPSFMWQSQDWFLNMWRRRGYILDFRDTVKGGKKKRCEGDYELQILRHGFQIFQDIRQESVEVSTLWMKLTRCFFLERRGNMECSESGKFTLGGRRKGESILQRVMDRQFLNC